MMRSVRLGLVVLGMAAGAAVPAAWADTAALRNDLAVRARSYVADGHADGISIAMTKCGVPAFITEGVANRGSGRKVTSRTVFEIGSVSKTFTALLLAHAVAEGKAKLDDDVRKYLPGHYGNLQWSDGTPITLEELADTTSGLPDFLPDPAPLAKVPADRRVRVASRMLSAYGNDDFLRDLHTIRLVARPGTVSRHSNVAAQMLGLIVGRIYDRPFGAVLEAKVERPLGMRDGTRHPTARAAATGYDDKGKVAPPYGGESITPAGGLWYSARDMAKYLALQTSRKGAAVRISQRIDFSGSPDRRRAFTWVVSTPRAGVRKYRMSGGTFGASSYIEFYPALGYGIVLMANRASADTQDELQAMAEGAFQAAGAALKPCR